MAVNHDPIAGMLSLCKRAGKLCMGFDQVKGSVLKGKGKLILFAQDLSPKTAQAIRQIAEYAHVPWMQTNYTMDEWWYLIGKRVGVIAVADKGFAQKIKALLVQPLSQQEK